MDMAVTAPATNTVLVVLQAALVPAARIPWTDFHSFSEKTMCEQAPVLKNGLIILQNLANLLTWKAPMSKNISAAWCSEWRMGIWTQSLLVTNFGTISMTRTCITLARIGTNLALQLMRENFCLNNFLELRLAMTLTNLTGSITTRFVGRAGRKLTAHPTAIFVENARTGGSGTVRFVTFARTASQSHVRGVEGFRKHISTPCKVNNLCFSFHIVWRIEVGLPKQKSGDPEQ